MRHAAAAIGAALVLVGPAAAVAHGPNPSSQRVLFDPDDPSFVYVATTVYGHFVSHDAGETYGWICSDRFASDTVESFPIDNVVLAGSGERTIVVAGSDGIFRSADDGCSWDPVDAFDGRRTAYVSVDPGDPDHLLATTKQGGDVIDNALFESFDTGDTWTRTGLTGAHFYRTALIHPQTGAWYVVSLDVEEGVSYLHRSDDQGGTWAPQPLPEVAGRTYHIAGLSPTDDTLVILRAGSIADDVLVVARESGADAQVVLANDDFLYEAWFRDDGTIWVGAGEGGVYVSEDDGETWERGPTEPGMYCFVHHQGSTYACGRQLEDQRGLSVSPDGGATWEPWFRYESLEAPLACLGEEEASMCLDEWRFEAQCIEFAEWGVDIREIPACEPVVLPPETGTGDSGGDDSGTGDAGAGGGAGDDSGCACRSREAPGGLGGVLLLWLAAAPRRRARPAVRSRDEIG